MSTTQSISSHLLIILFITTMRIYGMNPLPTFQLRTLQSHHRHHTSIVPPACYNLLGKILHNCQWRSYHNNFVINTMKANKNSDQEKTTSRNQQLLKNNKTIPSISTIQKRLSSNNDDHPERKNQNQNVYNTLQSSIQLLEENKSPEPIMSACHLLSFALKDDFQWEDNGFAILNSILSSNHKRNNEYEYTAYNNPKYSYLCDKLLTNEELSSFSTMIQRRLHNEPLQYIIGQWDFHDVVIKIRQPCLCPRPETEELVEYVAKDIRKMMHQRKANGRGYSNHEKIRVLDVGCGTGAISIALANIFSDEDVEFVAIDIAEEAIELTKENVKSILAAEGRGNEGDTDDGDIAAGKGTTSTTTASKKYQVYLSSAADFTNENNYDNSDDTDDNQYKFGFDIVVSNPPYIPNQDMKTLSEDVLDFEDYGALCGGEDGMDVIRDIVKRLPEWCHNRNSNDDGVCWMEVDTSQPQLMSEWLKPGNNKNVEFVDGIKDFYGLDRFVKLRIKNK
jgi:release factor glutamine methyltransferase